MFDMCTFQKMVLVQLLGKGNILKPILFDPWLLMNPVEWDLYEGWNFNSGNYLFTTDTK